MGLTPVDRLQRPNEARTEFERAAALAQNAWARHTWQRAIDRQQSPPQVAA